MKKLKPATLKPKSTRANSARSQSSLLISLLHSEIKKLRSFRLLNRTLADGNVSKCNNLNSVSKLLFYYQNVRSAQSADKFMKLAANISLSYEKLSIIFLTEIWLNDESNDAYYSFEGYTVYRSDISAALSAKYSGEGCLIAVSNSSVSSPIISNDHIVRNLFLKVSPNFSKFIVGAAYMSQDCSLNQFI